MPLYRTRSTPRGYWNAGAATTVVNAGTEPVIAFATPGSVVNDPWSILGPGSTWVIPIDGFYSIEFNCAIPANGVMSQYWAAIKSLSGTYGVNNYLALNSINAISGNCWIQTETNRSFRAGDLFYVAYFNGSATNQTTLNLAFAASAVGLVWEAPF